MSCLHLLIYLSLLSCSFSSNEIKTKYIQQPLDHFANSSTFQMLYFERSTYWKRNGPIFVYVNGEYAANSRYLKRGGMVRMAIETKGIMFVVEHRFYGRSVPAENSYKFLNTKQVLGDLAHFVKTIKADEKFVRSKVVLIGISYSGILASWARQKYPELIDAAWASSSPVLAKFNFYQYYEHLGELYKTYGGETCYKNIDHMFESQIKLLYNSEDQFKQDMNICSKVDLSKPLQKQVYFNRLIMKFDQNKRPEKIAQFCEQLRNNSAKEEKCDPTKFEYSLPRNQIDVAWAWQCCTEFGYFLTTSSNRQPFGKEIPVDFPIEKCKMFGKEFSKHFIEDSIDRTNEEYGGKKPKVSKVVFFNGGLDPWARLGILKNASNDVVAIFVKNAGHGDDFKPIKAVDNKEIMIARNIILDLIKKWIS